MTEMYFLTIQIIADFLDHLQPDVHVQ